jgi:hypothetical protein
MVWASTPTVDVRDDGMRARVAADGHLRLDLSGMMRPRRAKVHDAAPVSATVPAGMVVREADPKDPLSGQGPTESGFKTLDFKRSADGKWRARDSRGGSWLLRVSRDNSTYRVAPEGEDDPWEAVRQRQGDAALANPARAHSDKQHAAGMSRMQQLLDGLWKRKDAA